MEAFFRQDREEDKQKKFTDKKKKLEADDREKIEFMTTLTWKSKYFEEMHLHEDGRAWGFLIKNDGEILWASDQHQIEDEIESEKSQSARGKSILKAPLLSFYQDEQVEYHSTKYNLHRK